MKAGSVRLSTVRTEDGAELVAANLASLRYHEPWVYPCREPAAFQGYLKSCDGQRKIGFILRESASGRIAGVANLSEITRGALQSAYLGYYGMAGFAGCGLMREGLGLVLDRAFGPLGLHRVEANVQPGNTRSLALVRRLGFRREGFSPRYLKIGGEWRDHERWAMLAEEWASGESVIR
ncbi:MAG TPA: GNAT family N-acetyltransferase [Microvirga sp.]|nr:GNAT family N-acetyltransferase [Microvirga sp.]